MQKCILSIMVGFLLSVVSCFAQYGPHADQIYLSTNGWTQFASSGNTNLQSLLSWLDGNLYSVASGAATTNYVQTYAACKTNSNTYTALTTQSMYIVHIRDALAVTNSIAIDSQYVPVGSSNYTMKIQTGFMTNGSTNVTFDLPFSSTNNLVILAQWKDPVLAAHTNHIHISSYNATSFTYSVDAPLGVATTMWYQAIGRK